MNLRNSTQAETKAVRSKAARVKARKVLCFNEACSGADVADQTETVSRFKPDGTLSFVNDFCCQFFGKSRRELLGARWQSLAVAEDLPLIEEQLRGISPARPMVVIENRVHAAAGRVHWMQFVNRGCFDAQNRLLEIQCHGRDITERKLTEQRLTETLELNRTLIGASAMGIAAFTADGECILANEAITQIVGGSMLGLNFAQLPSWRRQGLLAIAREVLQTREPRELEFHGVTAFGREIAVSLHFTSFVSQARLHLLVFVKDLSQRKRAEALLQLQRDLGVSLSLTSDLSTALKCLLAAALRLETVDAVGIYLLDEATGELLLAVHHGISEAFVQRVRHYPADAPQTRLVRAGRLVYLPGEPLPDLTKEHLDLEGFQSAVVIPLSHEGQILGCLSLGSRWQQEIPAQTRMVAEAVAAQAAGAMARIRVESALRESQACLQTIIAGAPIFVFAVDRTGTITYEAGKGVHAFGPNPQQLIGRKVQELCAQYPQILENMCRALRGEEFRSTLEVGALVFDCWYTPTRDPSGEVTGYTGVATNITERCRLERQILEISDREQARIGQDIHDGLCQQLVGLAFDANALDQQLASQGRPEAATARRMADWLDEAITEARQLSRGLFPIRLEADGLISALEELARSTGERFGVQCCFQCPEPVLIPSQTMATHLYRIGQEAVSNAIKHARPQRITIQLLTQADTLELRVEDDGCGLSATALERLSGMGLHIMEYRARSLGGTLRLSPGWQGGTCVCCCLPCERR